MGEIARFTPVMPLVAAFSRYPAALAWSRETASELLGPVLMESPPFEFFETDYYTATMGAGLTKVFWAFERTIDPATLADLKRQTNALEVEYARLTGHPESRPLNLDPGYLTSAKLVLASTKDHAHRIALADGIYAEVTLYFKDGRWQHREWTFPDYRRADYQQFFLQCRELLRRREKEGRG